MAHLWATCHSTPRSKAGGTILPPALKRGVPLGRRGLFGHLAHLWAASNFAPPPPALKRWAPPRVAGVVATQPTCGPPLILPPRSEAVGIFRAAGAM